MDYAARAGSAFCATNLELDGDDSLAHVSRRKSKPIAVQPAAGGRSSAGDGPIAQQSGDLLPSDFFGAGTDACEAGTNAALPIPHVRQATNWDCGVACVAMVLSYLGLAWRLAELHELIGTKSVWTVDLADCLRKAAGPHLRFLYCTSQVGASDGHADLDMYAREFDDDAVRVDQLFRSASRLHIPYALRSVGQADLVRLLETRRAAVLVLVDLHVLRPNNALLASLRQTNASLASFLSGGGGSGGGSGGGPYAGHYILLTGVAGGRGGHPATFYYLDPGQAGCLRAIDGRTLDAARFATGTDEDVIIIEVPPQPHPSAPAPAYDPRFAAATSSSGMSSTSGLAATPTLSVCDAGGWPSSSSSSSLSVLDAAARWRQDAADALWKAFLGGAGAKDGGGGTDSGLKVL